MPNSPTTSTTYLLALLRKKRTIKRRKKIDKEANGIRTLRLKDRGLRKGTPEQGREMKEDNYIDDAMSWAYLMNTNMNRQNSI